MNAYSSKKNSTAQKYMHLHTHHSFWPWNLLPLSSFFRFLQRSQAVKFGKEKIFVLLKKKTKKRWRETKKEYFNPTQK